MDRPESELIRDEADAAAQRLARAPEAWRAWWSERGERELRCILMTAWDPIGVGDVAQAWDEYDGYLGGVAQQLLDGAGDDDAGAARVQLYLRHVLRDFMELEVAAGETAELDRLASALVAWHEWSRQSAMR